MAASRRTALTPACENTAQKPFPPGSSHQETGLSRRSRASVGYGIPSTYVRGSTISNGTGTMAAGYDLISCRAEAQSGPTPSPDQQPDGEPLDPARQLRRAGPVADEQDREAEQAAGDCPGYEPAQPLGPLVRCTPDRLHRRRPAREPVGDALVDAPDRAVAEHDRDAQIDRGQPVRGGRGRSRTAGRSPSPPAARDPPPARRSTGPPPAGACAGRTGPAARRPAAPRSPPRTPRSRR